ncbi:RNA-directed DNA polymerase (reverse transcriptase)-related family protein [Rhynchospora pubera]|uniref:RNA-directed DNA polymerase (Reverse transcriptase)-related family protein n=1 Tax=Rhynchospora pubera TaxID=906938 RepID=A0AAV8FEC9_9POAL|nr:RNA-directed DNA polymerase (reverse transcriptase)-related family protein [Rhynchospora pubera]
MLSHAGRLILIKSVLTTMPVYYMTIEMLPKRIVKDINSLMTKFFWGKTDQSRYLAFTAWNKVCKPIEMGGLGVKDLQSFGDALFLKLVWSLMADEEKPWVKVCKSKYYPNVGYWRARNVTGAHALSQPWFQGWLVQEEAPREDRRLRVNNLIDEHTGQWNLQQLNRLYRPLQVQQILQGNNKPNLNDSLEDRLIWQLAKTGRFTPKEGYKTIMQAQAGRNSDQNTLWEGVWLSKNITPKIKIFIWRLLNKGLPMAVHMHSRFPNFSPTCQRCHEENEFDMHCLFFCATSRQVWFASPLGLRVDDLPLQIGEALKQIMEGLDDHGVHLFTSIIWEVWKERNKAVIEHKRFNPIEVIQRVRVMLTTVTYGPTELIHNTDEVRETYEIMEGGWQVVLDASWDTTQRAVCAYIIYDRGILHSVGMHSVNLNDPFMAEAHAFLLAIIKVIQQVGITRQPKVQFFSDCINLVQAVNNCDLENLPSWRARGTVNNIIRRMEELQNNATLHHARREAVQQAHSLANTARRGTNVYSGYPNWQLRQQHGIAEEIDSRFFQKVQQEPP